jgi:hypothetical protein
MAKIQIPEINPLHFVDLNYQPLPQYNSKSFLDLPFEETIHQWEQYLEYAMPWQNNDAIRLQISSEIGPIVIKVVNASGFIVLEQLMQQGSQSVFNPAKFIYECDIALTPFEEGYYVFELHVGDTILRSNTLWIKDKHDHTLLVEYKHYRYFGEAYFETGFSPSLRIYGTMKYEKPSSKNVVYENQELDMTLLNAKPFNMWKLYVGGPEGVPDFVVFKMNHILCLSEVKVDGRKYVKASDGANLEPKEEENYPMRGWSIELRDMSNRMHRIYDEETGQIVDDMIVAINVEARGFVSDDNGGSYYEVEDIE